jgi:hypothetical protein
MIRWLGNRMVDGLCALVILAVLVEGPTLYAIARDRLK